MDLATRVLNGGRVFWGGKLIYVHLSVWEGDVFVSMLGC